MRDRPPEGIVVRLSLARIAQGSREALGAKPRNPRLDLKVRLPALVPQFVEVGVQLLVERTDAARAHPIAVQAHAGEAPHPNAVGEEPMVESPVDRPEERCPVSLALLVRELRRHGVELLVHPAVVAGEGEAMVGVHRLTRSVSVARPPRHRARTVYIDPERQENGDASDVCRLGKAREVLADALRRLMVLGRPRESALYTPTRCPRSSPCSTSPRSRPGRPQAMRSATRSTSRDMRTRSACVATGLPSIITRAASRAPRPRS